MKKSIVSINSTLHAMRMFMQIHHDDMQSLHHTMGDTYDPLNGRQNLFIQQVRVVNIFPTHWRDEKIYRSVMAMYRQNRIWMPLVGEPHAEKVDMTKLKERKWVHNGVGTILNQIREPVAEVNDEASPWQESIENAQLMSAAPDMAHALECMIWYMENPEKCDEVWRLKTLEIGIAALNKATTLPQSVNGE